MNKVVQVIKTGNAFARKDYWQVALTFMTWLVVLYQFTQTLLHHTAPPGAYTSIAIYLSIIIWLPVLYVHSLTVVPLTWLTVFSAFRWFSHEPSFVGGLASVLMLMVLWLYIYVRVVIMYRADRMTHDKQG